MLWILLLAVVAVGLLKVSGRRVGGAKMRGTVLWCWSALRATRVQGQRGSGRLWGESRLAPHFKGSGWRLCRGSYWALLARWGRASRRCWRRCWASCSRCPRRLGRLERLGRLGRWAAAMVKARA